MPQVHVVLALGQIAFEGCLGVLRDIGYQLPRLKFGHGLHYSLQRPSVTRPEHLIASYHPSRQNTQTGRLTPAMLDDVFALARALLES
jgi:uracil-DNA glycosylase